MIGDIAAAELNSGVLRPIKTARMNVFGLGVVKAEQRVISTRCTRLV